MCINVYYIIPKIYPDILHIHIRYYILYITHTILYTEQEEAKLYEIAKQIQDTQRDRNKQEFGDEGEHIRLRHEGYRQGTAYYNYNNYITILYILYYFVYFVPYPRIL